MKSFFSILTLLTLVAPFIFADYDYHLIGDYSASASVSTSVQDQPNVPGGIVQNVYVGTSATYYGDNMQSYSMSGSVSYTEDNGDLFSQTVIDINEFFIGASTDCDSGGIGFGTDEENPAPMPGGESYSSCGAAAAYAME